MLKSIKITSWKNPVHSGFLHYQFKVISSFSCAFFVIFWLYQTYFFPLIMKATIQRGICLIFEFKNISWVLIFWIIFVKLLSKNCSIFLNIFQKLLDLGVYVLNLFEINIKSLRAPWIWQKSVTKCLGCMMVMWSKNATKLTLHLLHKHNAHKQTISLKFRYWWSTHTGVVISAGGENWILMNSSH